MQPISLVCTTHHSDGVVEERLSEDDDVEDLVDVDLLEDGEDGDRVDGHDQRREEERLQDARRVSPEDAGQAARVQGAT